MNHVTVNLVLLGAQIDVYLLCAVNPAVALALADELLSVFGERALIVDEPRNATCLAASDNVELFALGKPDFKQALEASPSFRDQLQSIYFQRQ